MVVVVVLPVVYTGTVVFEEFRQTAFLPLPWTVAQMTITWDPLEGQIYYLVYEGELIPSPISAPWLSQSDFPTSLNQFDEQGLPEIALLVCDEQGDSCEQTPALEWE